MTREFWLWAGAKKASNSGELNLSLYEKCIAGGPSPESPIVVSPSSTKLGGKEQKTPITQRSRTGKQDGAMRRTRVQF